MKNKNGITLIALVVTIIVLLILAGISLNLIAGSNGIMERATKAADTYDEAKLKESLELSNAEMLIDCRGGGDLQTDLYDYIVERCNQNTDKTAQTSNGKYWMDSDGRLCYTDSDINRTVKLRKDSNGNPKIIDPNAPITTYRVQYDANGGSGVPTDTSEYEEGETVAIKSEVIPTREKYTFLGWATSASATAPEYTATGSFTMGEQNVTLYAVWTWVSGTGTSIIKGAYYGENVNYSANGCEDWKIFLNDGKNVYIIASDYVPNNGLDRANNIEITGTYAVYASDNRINFMNWLQNSMYWSKYAEGFNGATATGGATLPQFVRSWNEKGHTKLYIATKTMSDGLEGCYIGTNENPTSTWIYTSSASGYSDVLYYPHTVDYWNNTNGYWLASANGADENGVMFIMNQGRIDYSAFAANPAAVRPLVCLPASAKMTWNGSSWDLSN